MNIKKTLLTAAVAMGSICAFAQAPAVTTEYVFNPHWYVQGQFGMQETLGEASFGDLLSPNAQVAAGYQFNPLFGARLNLNFWQSKGAQTFEAQQYKWKWNYLAPVVNATFDLSHFILGYNPERLCDVNLFAGVGANFAFSNEEAHKANANILNLANTGLPTGATPLAGPALRKLWDGTTTRFVFQLGAALDFKVAENLKVGVEFSANTLADGYNSKKANNSDWYFNMLAGVKYTFGPTFSKREVKAMVDQQGPVEAEQVIVEKIVEKPVTIEVEKVQPMRRDIFFTINNTKIGLWEMQKVEQIANYLKEHPNAKVEITGYADKGTGTLAINLRLAKQRAQVVAKTLQNQFGIAADRISWTSMGESEEQPFKINELNRVAICVAE